MRDVVTAIGVTCAVLVTSLTASAQVSRPERPYRGLFGGGGDPDAAEVLTASGSIGAGYDTNVFAEGLEGGPSALNTAFPIRDAIYSMASGGLSYFRDGGSFDLGGSVFSSARYYPDLSDFLTTSHAAAVGISWQLTDAAQITANQTATYQPWQVLTYFPTIFDAQLGQALVPNSDFATGSNAYWNYMTAGGVSYRFSNRTSFDAGYSYQLSDFRTAVPTLNDDFESQSAFARVSRGLTRNLGLRLGYRYTDSNFSSEQGRYRTDALEGGLDYSRSLSITRRTRVSFSTGATALQEGTYRRYDVLGTALLDREIGRTWMAAAGYTRNVTFIETLHTPYFYDGVNLGLTGLITRRISFHAGAGATFGTLGLVVEPQGNDRFDTGYGNTGVSYAITRHLSTSIDYVYYTYWFDRAALPEFGLAPNLSRHGVRVALNAWAPIFQRGRRPNATR